MLIFYQKKIEILLKKFIKDEFLSNIFYSEITTLFCYNHLNIHAVKLQQFLPIFQNMQNGDTMILMQTEEYSDTFFSWNFFLLSGKTSITFNLCQV